MTVLHRHRSVLLGVFPHPSPRQSRLLLQMQRWIEAILLVRLLTFTLAKNFSQVWVSTFCEVWNAIALTAFVSFLVFQMFPSLHYLLRKSLNVIRLMVNDGIEWCNGMRYKHSLDSSWLLSRWKVCITQAVRALADCSRRIFLKARTYLLSQFYYTELDEAPAAHEMDNMLPLGNVPSATLMERGEKRNNSEEYDQHVRDKSS